MTETINLALEMGTINDEHGRISVASRFKNVEATCLGAEFRAFAEKSLLAPQLGAAPNAFAEVCAWLLLKRADQLPREKGPHESLRTLIQNDGLSFVNLRLKNDQVWGTLMYWLRFLGLAWQSHPDNCRGIVPDACEFISRHLDELIPHNEDRVEIRDFQTRLGQLCPVLDGGSIHITIRNQFRSNGKALPDDLLSPGLSLALRRLQDEDRLSYTCPNDATVFMRLGDQSQEHADRIAFLTRPTN